MVKSFDTMNISEKERKVVELADSIIQSAKYCYATGATYGLDCHH